MKRLSSKMLLLAVAVLAFGIMIQSCKSTKDSAKGSASAVTIDGTWILQTFEGAPAANSFKGKIPSMTIYLAEKRINGNGGCNRFFGTFTYEKNILSAPKLGATLMACIDDNKEGQFLEMLGKSNEVTVTESTLTLSNGGKAVAEFVKGIDLSAVAGSTWTLEAIDGKDAKALFDIKDKLPTLEFNLTESRISGNAGCNRYNAGYKLEGSALTIGPAMLTKMACPNLSGESAYTKALSGVSNLKITDSSILFIRDGKEVLKFGKAAK